MRKKTIENTWAVWCIGQIVSNHDISRFLRLMRLWRLFERVKRARCTNSFHRLSPGVASKIQNMGAMRLGSKQSRKSVFWFPSIVNHLFFGILSYPVSHLGLSIILGTYPETGLRTVRVAVDCCLRRLLGPNEFSLDVPSFGILLAHCLQMSAVVLWTSAFEPERSEWNWSTG